MNRAPTAVGSLGTLTIEVGVEVMVNVASNFNDPDGDALTYTAVASNAAVASASVSGSVVTVTGIGVGTANITVTATDPGSLSAMQSMGVTVEAANQAPVPVGSLDSLTIEVGAEVMVNVASNFNDPDGDALTFSAATSDAAVASASVSGSVVTVTGIGVGMADITVTATDPGGLSATQSMGVTVEPVNQPPIVVGTLEGQTMKAGDTLTADVAEFFEDPEGDELSFVAVSADTTVATTSIAGSVLTVMAMAEGTTTVEVRATDTEDNFAALRFEVTVREAASSGIMGRVSVEGESLEGVTVSLTGGPDATDMTTMTDAAGQYSFAKLRAGAYAVGISGYDMDDYEFENASQNVTVGDNQTANVPFEGVLLRTSGISGRVSVEGMGLADITVTLSMADADDATAMTDAGGHYRFAGLATGDYAVAISGYDTTVYQFDVTSKTVTIGDDETAILNFEGARVSSSTVCPPGSSTWMGIPVCDTGPREGYDRDAFGTEYRSLEDEIVDSQPQVRDSVYTSYTCKLFEINEDGTADTDVDHIVALAEAYDSGLDSGSFRDFGKDLDNLTLADPTVNRHRKSDNDAAEWSPTYNRGWYAARIVAVKQKYGMSVNPAERDSLSAILSADTSRVVNCN